MGIGSAAKERDASSHVSPSWFQSPMGIVSAAKNETRQAFIGDIIVSIPDGDRFRREAAQSRGCHQQRAVSIPDGDSFRREVDLIGQAIEKSKVSIPDGDRFRREAAAASVSGNYQKRFNPRWG